MKAKKFWYLRWLEENGETQLFIVDGKGDIVFKPPFFPTSDASEYYTYQEICNLHNLTHLEDSL